MIKINSESELMEQLKKDIESCKKPNVVLQAGHFPLMYSSEGAMEAISQWGQFSNYSLELACRLGKFAREMGKTVQFVFFADDHAYESFNTLRMGPVRTGRNRLYRVRSGIDAQLNPEYQRILQEYGFDVTHVLRHDHGKPGRRNCLYFSEKVLRASSRKIENICAREYTEFIENPVYFDKAKSHIVSFVPNKCIGHICDVALDLEIAHLSASHVFIETMAPFATREELYNLGRGVTYRRDPK